jgi:exosortase
LNVNAKQLTGAALILAAMSLVFWQVFVRLVDAWIVDGNYSPGFLILPIALYFVWERREKLAAAPIQPSWLGLVVLAGGIGILLAGLWGSELFLSRVALLPVIAGIILFLFGRHYLRILAFPIAFLFLMIPIPAIIFNQIAFPLQLLASRLGEWAIATAGIPVYREGNVLILAHTSLEVAEACSGIRSLVSLITLGLVYGYFMDSRAWVRTLIVLSAIPVAIVANGARVAGTGMAAQWMGEETAQGFFHEFSGWIVFIFAFAMILIIQRVILRFAPRKK